MKIFEESISQRRPAAGHGACWLMALLVLFSLGVLSRGGEVAELPFYDGFEDGSLRPWWMTRSTGTGRIQVFNTPFGQVSKYDLRMDDAVAGGDYARNELTLRINLAGYTNVVLQFTGWDYSSDVIAPPPNPFVDGADFNGIAISQDGTNWFNIGFPDLEWFSQTIVWPLDDAIARFGLNYNSDFRIRFNQYGYSPMPMGGMGLDDIVITGMPSTIPNRLAWAPLPGWHPAGIPLPVTVRAVNAGGSVVTGYNGAASLQAFANDTTGSDGVLGNQVAERHLGGSVGTGGFVFVPQTNITVTHFRHYSGTNVSIWTDSGILLASKPVTSIYQTWTETALDTPVELQAGQRYRLGFVSGEAGFSSAFTSPWSDGLLDFVQGCHFAGEAFPALLDPVGFQMPFVGLRYRPGALTPVPLAPNEPVIFSNGVWTGFVTLHEPHPSVHLLATDGSRLIGASLPFAVEPFLPIFVSLPESASEGEGVLTNQGRIRLTYPSTNDVVVTLSSQDPTEIAVPAQVFIPQGQTSALFDVTIVDDAQLDATRFGTVVVTAANYATNSATMLVYDNEPGLLRVIVPESVGENAGTLTDAARVELNAPATGPASIRLFSSNPQLLQVPASVYLSAGVTSAFFSLTVMDNLLIDGPRSVSVTAQVQGWTTGFGSLTVRDDEGTNVLLRWLYANESKTGIPEHAGTVTNLLRLDLNGQAASNTVFYLTSSDSSELTVPPTVTVPLGRTNVFIPVSIVDDHDYDGQQIVMVSVSAPGFGGSSTNILVADDEVHHYDFAPIGMVQTSTVPFQIVVNSRDINGALVPSVQPTITLSATGDLGAVEFRPTSASLLNAGYWRAAVTITNGAHTNVRLTASDQNGRTGESNPFTVVAASNQVTRFTNIHVEGLDVVLEFTSVAGRHYRAEHSTTLPSPVWAVIQDSILGTGGIVTVTHRGSGAAPGGFYRVALQP